MSEVVNKAKQLLQFAYAEEGGEGNEIRHENNDTGVALVDNEIRELLDEENDGGKVATGGKKTSDFYTFIEDEVDGSDLSFLEAEAYKNDNCPDYAKGLYSTCTSSALSKHIASVLKSDYGFEEIEKEFWFKSKAPDLANDEEDSAMYRPKNETPCEWCDRSVFSFVDNRFENSIVLYSKISLSKLILRNHKICGDNFAPTTYIVRYNESSGKHEFDPRLNPSTLANAETNSSQNPCCYFLKDDEADYGTGVFAYKTIDECISNCKKGHHYVIQPHVESPLLYQGHKFSVRIYGLIVSPPGPERKINILVYKNGYLAVAGQKWDSQNLAHESQVSTNRSLRLKNWEHYDAVMPQLVDMSKKILFCGSKEFVVARKRTWELFGLDFLIDTNLKPWLLEINSGPVTKEMDFPMLKGLVKIGIIGLKDPRPMEGNGNCDIDELKQHVDGWEFVKFTRARYALKNEIGVTFS